MVLMIKDYSIDDSSFPLRLGSPLRTPHYGWRNWGIDMMEYLELVKGSDELYSIEWKGGSPRQMQYVIEATKGMEHNGKAYGDILRDSAAEKVRELCQKKNGIIRILDIGAGVSTERIFDALPDDKKENVHIYMIEPSETRLNASVEKLFAMFDDFCDNNKIYSYKGTDLDIPYLIYPETIDIVTAVAVLHHHGSRKAPLSNIYNVLKKGGYFICADWCNSMWDHPNKVYRFLQSLDKDETGWPSKEDDLKRFVDAYPNTVADIKKQDALLEDANEKIGNFWKNWIMIRHEAIQKGEFDEKDELYMLEAHTPVVSLKNDVTDAKLNILNSTYHLPDSGLLATVVATKY